MNVIRKDMKGQSNYGEVELIYPDDSRVVMSTDVDGYLRVELFDDHNRSVEVLLDTMLQTPWKVKR
jgi:hypothetical protein